MSGLAATALFDFAARESHELTIKKGDALLLPPDTASHPGWVLASKGGQQGLIPENYISKVPVGAPAAAAPAAAAAAAAVTAAAAVPVVAATGLAATAPAGAASAAAAAVAEHHRRSSSGAMGTAVAVPGGGIAGTPKGWKILDANVDRHVQAGSHTLYVLQVRSGHPSGHEAKWEVRARYSEMEKVSSALKKAIPGNPSLGFPGKFTEGSARQSKLAAWLQAIVARVEGNALGVDIRDAQVQLHAFLKVGSSPECAEANAKIIVAQAQSAADAARQQAQDEADAAAAKAKAEADAAAAAAKKAEEERARIAARSKAKADEALEDQRAAEHAAAAAAAMAAGLPPPPSPSQAGSAAAGAPSPAKEMTAAEAQIAALQAQIAALAEANGIEPEPEASMAPAEPAQEGMAPKMGDIQAINDVPGGGSVGMCMGGSKPLWRHRAFVDFFADSHVGEDYRADSLESPAAALSDSLYFFLEVLKRLGRRSDLREISITIADTHRAFNEAMDLSQRIGSIQGDTGRLFTVVQHLCGRVRQMRVGEVLVVPGGWCREDDTGRMVLFCIQRKRGTKGEHGAGQQAQAVGAANDICSFSVSNTGMEGRTFQPCVHDPLKAKTLRELTMIADNIPIHKLCDSSFWMPALMQVAFPSDKNRPRTMYDVLIPHLNMRPVFANPMMPLAPVEGGDDTGDAPILVQAPALTPVPGGPQPGAGLARPPTTAQFVSKKPARLIQGSTREQRRSIRPTRMTEGMDRLKKNLRSAPRGADSSHARLVAEAMHQFMKLQGLPSLQAKHISMLVRFQLIDMMKSDLNAAGAISCSDSTLIRIACDQLSHCAAKQARLVDTPMTAQQLAIIQQLTNSIRVTTTELRAKCSDAVPPRLLLDDVVAEEKADDAAKPEQVMGALRAKAGAEWGACFPMMGRLRRDYDIEHLAGSKSVPPIILPVQLTLVPDAVHSFNDVANAMRHAVHLCLLLSNQDKLIKNTMCIRVSLLTHLFTGVIPLPLPLGHPQREAQCFWVSQPMRYETQADILRLTALLARHFASASLSLKLTRSFDATRILTLGCMATIADVVMRIKACDIPSQLCLHYSGQADGPVLPFGFEMGAFAVESECLKFTTPELTTAYSLVLDYFAALKQQLTADHIIFKWEEAAPGTKDLAVPRASGETMLLQQVALQFGYPAHNPDDLAAYLTGQLPSFVEHLPELAFFRDIVFLFKLMLAPSSEALPVLRRWQVTEAELNWKYTPAPSGAPGEPELPGRLIVVGFRGMKLLPCAFSQAKTSSNLGNRSYNILGRIKRALGLGATEPRIAPSAANPTVLVHGKITEEPIETEDDVLHIQKMPDFGGRLKARDSELLLQYLTVPYLRIPLVLQFFSDPVRIAALHSIQLQGVLDGCLFEPGAWLDLPSITKTSDDWNDDVRVRPTHCPAETRDHLATPSGLLFNELMKAPQLVVGALERMMHHVIDLDTGRYVQSSGVILYIVRLMVRVEGFIRYVIRHTEWAQGREEEVAKMKAAAAAGSAPTKQQEDSLATEYRSGVGYRSCVRGLRCQKAVGEDSFDPLERLRAHHEQMMVMLKEEVFPLLERWSAAAIKRNEMANTCILQAHLAYLFKNVEEHELTRQIVSTMLIAQQFLTVNYRYDVEVRHNYGEGKGEKAERERADGRKRLDTRVDAGLLMPQTDLFDIFTKHRKKLLAYLEANPKVCNEVMESVVRVVTLTGNRTKAKKANLLNREWKSMLGYMCRGRFAPDTDASGNGAAGIDKLGQPTLSTEEASDAAGEFVPGSDWDLLRRKKEEFDPATTFEKWLWDWTTQVVDMEINVQLGEFSVRRNNLQQLHMQPHLDEGIYEDPDFIGIFGRMSDFNGMQCAEVQNTQNRTHVRLVGRRHDLQWWVKDKRLTKHALQRPYDQGNGLLPAENWLFQNLEAVRRQQLLGCDLFLQEASCERSGYVRLMGRATEKRDKVKELEESLKPLPGEEELSEKEKKKLLKKQEKEKKKLLKEEEARAKAKAKRQAIKDKRTAETGNEFSDAYHVDSEEEEALDEQEAGYLAMTMKEVIVFRKTKVVHIYNIVEHGRRFFRTLVFASQAGMALHELRPSSAMAEMKAGAPYYMTGTASSTVAPTPSLLISRSLSKALGKQDFVPRRLMEGLLPDALLNQYVFWQNADDSLSGYQRENDRNDPGMVASRLHVKLIPTGPADTTGNGCAEANAIIRRIPICEGGTVDATLLASEKTRCLPGLQDLRDVEDTSKQQMTLVNIMYATEDLKGGLLLVSLRELISRIESLAHVLVWSRGQIATPNQFVFPDLIELPRLRLSFTTRVYRDPGTSKDQLRLWSNDHEGMFISNRRSNAIEKLVRGIPHSLLLESESGELAVLVPATAKPSRPKSHSTQFSNELLLDRGDSEGWNAAIVGECRHYLYRVHASHSFLFTPTFESALYLLLLRFLHRDYEEVFRLADSCANDMPLTAEQAQIFEQLEYLGVDLNPNAHACRLKLSLATMASGSMRPPWSPQREMEQYLVKYAQVFSSCRLTEREEIRLLESFDFAAERHAIHIETGGSTTGSAVLEGRASMAQENLHLIDNRLRFLRAVEKARGVHRGTPGSEPPQWLEPFQLSVTPPPDALDFDMIVDVTALQRDSETGWLKALAAVSYKRPNCEVVNGPVFADYMATWMQNGFKLSGGKDGLGFLFIYELFTGTMSAKMLAEDRPANWGSMLMRMLPIDDQTNKKSFLMSLLRIFARNPHIAETAPHFADTRRLRTTTIFKGSDVFSGLLKKAAAHVQLKQSELTFPDEFVPTFEQAIDAPRMENPEFVKLRDPLGVGDRRRYAPRVDDYSCNSRRLHAHIISDTLGNNLSCTPADVEAFAGQPLAVLPGGLDKFVKLRSLTDRSLPPVSAAMPFSVDKHRASQFSAAQKMVKRVADDIGVYAGKSNGSMVPQLTHLFDEDVTNIIHTAHLISAGDDAGDFVSLDRAMAHVDELRSVLWESAMADQDFMKHAIEHSVHEANYIETSARLITDDQERQKRLAFIVCRSAGKELQVEFDYLTLLLLKPDGAQDLHRLNPFIERDAARNVMQLVASALLRASRMTQTLSALGMARDLFSLLQRIKREATDAGKLVRQRSGSEQPRDGRMRATSMDEFNMASMGNALDSILADSSLRPRVTSLASDLASVLAVKRHYVSPAGNGIFEYDPRFLVFEFTYSIMLRKAQVELVRQLAEAAASGRSECHQMIMGAGKTTVIGPLLALLLADGSRLVMQCVPRSLLEFSRSVVREKFSAVIRKSIYTFMFTRTEKVEPSMLAKFLQVEEGRGIMVTHPTAIKSFQLKFIEVMHLLNKSHHNVVEDRAEVQRRGWLQGLFGFRKKKPLDLSDVASFRSQASICAKIVGGVFKKAALILDEVDMILHPLRSELNWPVGEKEALDFTRSTTGMGLRWQLPWHLMDAIFVAASDDATMTVPFTDSREARTVLAKLREAFKYGAKERLMQTTPHVVLLSRNFYRSHLRALLSQWMIVWLRAQSLAGMSDEQMSKYLEHGARSLDGDPAMALYFEQSVSGDHVKMLNLAHDWLTSYLPFIMAKINRVGFGLLSPADLATAAERDPGMPRSRKLLAVPFMGKDVPSEASEFSHPDVVIGLTMMAYRHQSLRMMDFTQVMKDLRERMEEEHGPYMKRPACQTFIKWVHLSGGRVRGTMRRGGMTVTADGGAEEPMRGRVPAHGADNSSDDDDDADPIDDIWPLQLIDLRDEFVMGVLFRLLRALPHIIEMYLHDFIFPLTMEHQGIKLTSNGQDLGGNMLFENSLGFSGTPSDLLPLELGDCQYEAGTDGKVISFLTDTEITSHEVLPLDWTVESVIDHIANASPPFFSLIDTGALVTGLTNYEVARALLERGLRQMEGVIFLDDNDRQMILQRTGWKVMQLAQSGISKSKRFAFFDQVRVHDAAAGRRSFAASNYCARNAAA